MATKSESKKIGRPPILTGSKEQLDMIEGLAKIQCTQAEAAAVLGVTRQTFCEFLNTNEEAREKWELGADGGKASLRRVQFKTALGGNATMQIWLGKQHLGQSDKNELSGPGGTPLPAPTTTIYQLPDNGRGAPKARAPKLLA